MSDFLFFFSHVLPEIINSTHQNIQGVPKKKFTFGNQHNFEQILTQRCVRSAEHI